ncbi:MAG: leucine-rich repeat domain-containing protein [Clostridiales bacterium]|nr:leucine-rich repeat domain-containing protein [Clostridiales bacterium]
MKKAKKFFVGLLVFASISAFTLGVAACGDDGTDAGTLPPKEENTIEQVYDTYVEYATKKGQKPLDYETWLNTIKGADGVGIKSVEVDDDGMIITLTDGTVLPAIELPTGEPIEKGATRNLHYQRIAGKEEYRVIGLGLASEQDIVISSTYNGLPVTEIGDYAFEVGSYITSVKIPNTVTTIGGAAFRDCVDLVSVTIPDSVTTIGSSAFNNCYSLTNVYYMGDYADWWEVEFGGTNANPLSNGADLYLNNQKFTNWVIPDGVEVIKDYAFTGCASLTSITIPDSVTTIGRDAFADCDNLISVTIPNSVTLIAPCAFCGEKLESVIFDDTSTWYCVSYYAGFGNPNWPNKTGGTQVDVSDSAQMSKKLANVDNYWYKL